MHAKVRITQITKNAMQSGQAQTDTWKLEFLPEKPGFVDHLMGWNGMTDMPQELNQNLLFPSKEDAIAYAKTQRLPFTVLEKPKRRLVRKAYADNFKFDKVMG